MTTYDNYFKSEETNSNKKLTTQSFIEKAIIVHGDNYDYSLVDYINARTKVPILCKVHGIFEQTPDNHLHNHGCKQCTVDENKHILRAGVIEFVIRANKIHNNRYDYSLVIYENNSKKIKIICSEHGEFLQIPKDHLNGSGCPVCANIVRGMKQSSNKEEFILKAIQIHLNTYNYELVEYTNNNKKIKIICSEHGVFEQTPCTHLNGSGCPVCATIRRRQSTRYSTDEFIQRAGEVHSGKYDYSLVEYDGCFSKVKIICPVHGIFEQTPDCHLQNHNCPKCSNTGTSKAQIEIEEYITSMGYEIETRNRQLIGEELDIIIHSHKLAIEYNGLYWHREGANKKLFKKEHHYEKMKLANKMGYELITIFEDEWLLRSEVVKKILKHKFGLTEKGTVARKLQIKQIDNKLAIEFLEKEHIQGAPHSIKISLGAIDGERLVAVMTFGHPTRQNSAEWELSRFATDEYSHVGVANKLFKYFINNYNPREIVSFSDNRWFDGGVYPLLGFKYSGNINIDHFYVKNDKRFHKSNFRKKEIVRKFNYNFEKGETEWEAMEKLKFHRIWDCGKKRWLWNKY